MTLNFKEVTDSNFDEYALELSKYWGVGQKGSDNGLSIVISPNLRRIRICTGLGTEKIITDSICQQILDNKIMPQLRYGKYFEGINQATNELIRVWNNIPSHPININNTYS
ncbi:TPM domain-containing protein [Sphingobacterium litopenaei]|uniref:TPM domain-containing protein n=1 Tax=Sphingobacterium litopenaei TaxID=2763500 RepID=A0ABR7YH15_9SPHI|nr:TPM domain-containing protein [Sphingobacterium litopenaei]MBD1430617.1 TPM domain-containing protein [Sphingobacterium litopenaei]